LLVLLFAANWFFPQPLAEPAGDEVNRPVIRIASLQQPPERIVIDTNLPTIVPPPAPAAEAIPDEPPPQAQSFAPITSHASVTSVEKSKSKPAKRLVKEAAAKHPSSPHTQISTPVAPSSSPAPAAPPTRLSFANIISGQLVRELFNLH
jgi:hypothetical protein